MPGDPFGTIIPLRLAAPAAPAAQVRQLLAIDTVRLTAQGVPRAALVGFYAHTLGLARVPEELPHLLVFRHGRRRITLSPDDGPGLLALAITQFSTLLAGLGRARLPHEVLRFDGGLARMVVLRDPAANIIHLLETRPF